MIDAFHHLDIWPLGLQLAWPDLGLPDLNLFDCKMFNVQRDLLVIKGTEERREVGEKAVRYFAVSDVLFKTHRTILLN